MPSYQRSFWVLLSSLLAAYLSLAFFDSGSSTSLLGLPHPRRFLNKHQNILSYIPGIQVNHDTTPSTLEMIPRLSQERGHADHGWLKTFHTFSFASYQDYNHQQHGPLRVINEDRVAPGTGFGTHSHSEFEIFSYIVKGALEHKDSIGNTEILRRGAVQLTSAGTGVSHSEMTFGDEEVHFLQIWSIPHTRGLKPNYFTREFTDEEKINKLVPIVAPARSKGVSGEREAKGPAPVESALTLYATILEPGKKVQQRLTGKKGYVQVIQTSGYSPIAAKTSGAAVRVGDGEKQLELREGDGAYLNLEEAANFVIENVGNVNAEVLLFDLE